MANDGGNDHPVFREEELINVKMSVKHYRRMMSMIERDESMSVVGKYVKTVVLGIAGVLTAWLFLWDFLKDRLLGH